MTIKDIYFPIKSNIDFFEKKSNQPDLIAKIKQSILLYDNLYFDAGVYAISCGDNGSFASYYPPEQMHLFDLDVPESTSSGFYVNMKIEPNGQPFSPILYSDNSKNYTVCFQKLISDMGIQEEDFIKFGIHELTSSGKQRLSKNMWNTGESKDFIKGSRFCKEQILENFYLSLLCSETISAPIMVDSLHNKLIENLSKNLIKKADLRLEVFNRINNMFKYQIPDFSSLSTDEILDLRKDKLFSNFRSTILKINDCILEGFEEPEEPEIESLFIKELMEEAKEFTPSKKKLEIDGALMLLGFMPYIGNAASVGSYVNEIKSFKDFQNSSLAFIMRYIE